MIAEEADGTVQVLLVDDHHLMREGLAKLLREEADIEVVAQAADGREAVEMARKVRPDCILMDVSMPEMSGTEATRIIKDEMPQVRIIGLSMHDLDGTRETMLKAGADVYLTKDGPPEKLLASIRECRNGQE